MYIRLELNACPRYLDVMDFKDVSKKVFMSSVEYRP